MQHRYIVPLLLALGLSIPLPAAAAEEMEEAIYPPCQTVLYYTAGNIEMHLDSRFSYSSVEIYRSQQEGQFLYYDYDLGIANESCLYFPLIEGEYIVLLTVPTNLDSGTKTYSFSCTISDPDMDEEQAIDSSRHSIYLECDAEARADVTQTWEEGVVDRVVLSSTAFTMAGNGFSLGDLTHDGLVDATDTAHLLMDAALVGSGQSSQLTLLQQKEADLSLNGMHDATDGSMILKYSACSASGEFQGSLLEYIQQS